MWGGSQDSDEKGVSVSGVLCCDANSMEKKLLLLTVHSISEQHFLYESFFFRILSLIFFK